MAETIGIFPLEYVLLPGLPLPLHIFEPRYRQLIADVRHGAGAHGAFGVVLSKAAALSGVGGGAAGANRGEHVLAGIGTMAEIVEKESYPDGRFDLLTVGSQRFRVEEVDATSRPYLQARVTFLPELEGKLEPSVVSMARRLSSTYADLLAVLGGLNEKDELSTDSIRASYQIASRLHLSAQERQSLLAADTAADRLLAEIDILRREVAIVQATRSVPVPPQILHVPASVS